MVQLGSIRKVGDNSGVREVKCIKVIQKVIGKQTLGGQVGKVVRSIVKKYRKGTKWKRGMRVKGVRVMRGKERSRKDGIWFKGKGLEGMGGSIVVVNKKLDPYANRSRRVISKERRGKGYGKVLARSGYTV